MYFRSFYKGLLCISWQSISDDLDGETDRTELEEGTVITLEDARLLQLNLKQLKSTQVSYTRS